MHELSLTQAVVNSVAERFGPTRVVAVSLEIGKLSGVVVDSIRFCFDLVAEGTTLAGARLEIVEPCGRARCRSCSQTFDVDDPIVLCPTCGSANVEVLSGRELRILSVELSGEERSCAPHAAAPTTPE
jgi:hydrogenase nickel incorporation protein HypA/HybF